MTGGTLSTKPKPTKPKLYVGADPCVQVALRQVFSWSDADRCPDLVVVWDNARWADKPDYWRQLVKFVDAQVGDFRVLVVHLGVGAPPTCTEDGECLGLLLRHVASDLALDGESPLGRPIRCVPITKVEQFAGAMFTVSGKPHEAMLRKDANEACGLDESTADRTQSGFQAAAEQWRVLTGRGTGAARRFPAVDAFTTLEALMELRARPDVIVFDDLAGLPSSQLGAPLPAARAARRNWQEFLDRLNRVVSISRPVLPVQVRHGEAPDELLPIVRAEIDRLARPVAALVDMHWLYADTEGADRAFGLQLIKLIRAAKPSLPIFVWSTIADKQVLQRAMQYGAVFYFDKQAKYSYGHMDATRGGEETPYYLNFGKLWFHLLEWESTRYQPPLVGRCGESFLSDSTPETAAARARFLKTFELTEGDLLIEDEPPVERLLRALVPEASEVDILRFFGEGRSGSEPPFVVRGRTSDGRWLRPVQIKLSRDWRALARESKGYRDVVAGSLGPSVAHVESGPYRLGEWCGLSQSFAAPEEAIRSLTTRSTRSLAEYLQARLDSPEDCRAIVDAVFNGVLDPFYKDNLRPARESVIKAFDRVSPAHLEAVFEAVDHKADSSCLQIDLTPEALSLKSGKARREMAYRAWRKAEEWIDRKADSTRKLIVRGLVVDTIEIDRRQPLRSRLRLLDRTLGIKVDLNAGSPEVARRWQALASCPVKLRGLPVDFMLTSSKFYGSNDRTRLLGEWQRFLDRKRHDSKLRQGRSCSATGSDSPSHIASYFTAYHPLDWTEEFHLGPTHGDLNPGNILLHDSGGAFFPWLIDFDKAEPHSPVVFDLAKLEIEVYHTIAQDLYWELVQLDQADSDEVIPGLFNDFEQALEAAQIHDIEHLWDRFRGRRAVPALLKRRFAGLFAYLKQVHARVAKLGLGRREFLLGRTLYCFCSLKFQNLYKAKDHPNAPFPAQVLYWKLESLVDCLDAENGIRRNRRGSDYRSAQEKAVAVVVDAIRSSRNAETKDRPPLFSVVATTFNGPEIRALRDISTYAKKPSDCAKKPSDAKGWEFVFRLLRDGLLPGKYRWFRELLWYARDFGVAKSPGELAQFIAAIVRASNEPSEADTPDAAVGLDKRLEDFASTGRPGNAYPGLKMFEQLAKGALPFVKISSRGDSGGTIDILEQAGVPLCESREAIDREVRSRGWALASASASLCHVDKILMDLRRENHCMKVKDLVIASITAKKLAVGIGRFTIQVVTGYDAKFPDLLRPTHEGGDALVALDEALRLIHARWTETYREAAKLLIGSDSEGNSSVDLAEPAAGFDSDHLRAWFPQDGGSPSVVFGSALLAAQLWRQTPDRGTRLRERMPQAFSENMKELAGVLEAIEKEAILEPATRRSFISLRKLNTELASTREPLKRPEHLHLCGVHCWRSDTVAPEVKDMRDIAVVFLSFRNDVRDQVRVPFFDEAAATLADTGHPLASIVFGPRWIAVLWPKWKIPSDLHAWCWRVLREGFDDPPLRGQPSPPPPAVELEAKFRGDRETYERLVALLQKQMGFKVEKLGRVERLHLYFRNAATLELPPPLAGLRAQGEGTPVPVPTDARLRLIVKREGGVRYDYKSLVGSGGQWKLSIDKELQEPVPLPLAIVVEKLSEGLGPSDIADLRSMSPAFSVVLRGGHEKTRAVSNEFEFEVSWDDLVLLNTGDPLRELEIELKRGDADGFKSLMSVLEKELNLTRVAESKHVQAIGLIQRYTPGKEGE